MEKRSTGKVCVNICFLVDSIVLSKSVINKMRDTKQMLLYQFEVIEIPVGANCRSLRRLGY